MKQRLLLLFGFLLIGVACTALQEIAPAEAYVSADRETFEAIAPVIRALADEDTTNDPDLTGTNGAALLLLVESWETRIIAAEGSDL